QCERGAGGRPDGRERGGEPAHDGDQPGEGAGRGAAEEGRSGHGSAARGGRPGRASRPGTNYKPVNNFPTRFPPLHTTAPTRINRRSTRISPQRLWIVDKRRTRAAH